MRNPPRFEVWVHVDRIDRPDGRVMAVQYRGARGAKVYATVSKVEFYGVPFLSSRFFGRRSKLQPRVVIRIPRASVRITDTAPNVRLAIITVGDQGTKPPYLALDPKRAGV